MRLSVSARAFGNRLRTDPVSPSPRHWPNTLEIYALGLILICAISSAQVTSPAILELDVENIVSYSSDVFDASKFATDSNLTTATPPKNFGFVMAVGDILAVNGKPAKGSLIARQQAIILSPNPAP